LRPLDEIDFEERDWVPYSGWPFKKSHLDSFYEKAQVVCRIGPFAYDAEDWEEPAKRPQLPFRNGRVKTVMFQFGSRDPFIKEYPSAIKRSSNVKVFLHGTVIQIESSETGGTVTEISARTLEGNTFKLRAKLFVLAAGGLENPRIMLLANRVQKEGLGNVNDLVGRFFMEHIHLWSGQYVPPGFDFLEKTGLYKIHKAGDVPVMAKWALSEDALRKEKILNYCTSIHPRILKKSRQNLIYRLNHMTEQAPNPESRVTLSEERDRLGRNRARLDWRVTPLDVQSLNRAQEIIDEELRRSGLGRLEIKYHDEKTVAGKIHGGWHHMGTTRMHKDPKRGVVDENCRVHGISNLYVAGPSVFPTGGYANPVLTVVALALRLAQHIKGLMP
jgi:hypothetical protein